MTEGVLVFGCRKLARRLDVSTAAASEVLVAGFSQCASGNECTRLMYPAIGLVPCRRRPSFGLAAVAAFPGIHISETLSAGCWPGGATFWSPLPEKTRKLHL